MPTANALMLKLSPPGVTAVPHPKHAAEVLPVREWQFYTGNEAP